MVIARNINELKYIENTKRINKNINILNPKLLCHKVSKRKTKTLEQFGFNPILEELKLNPIFCPNCFSTKIKNGICENCETEFKTNDEY